MAWPTGAILNRVAGVLWWSRAAFLEACFASQSRELEEVDLDAIEAFDKEHARS